MSDFHKVDGEKVYAAMEKDLRNAILKGELKTDVPIITEGEFEEKYKISRKSVRKAIQSLCDEGLLIKKQGSGTYVVPIEERAKFGSKKNLRILFISDQFNPDLKPATEYMESLVIGMSEFAFRMNWQLNFTLMNGLDSSDVISNYKKAMFDGIVWSITGGSFNEQMLHIKESSIPQVTINRTVEKLCSVYYDRHSELADTVSFLASLGHRDIAFVNAHYDESVYNEREESFIEVTKKLNIPSEFYYKIHLVDFIKYLDKIFSLSRRPTAMILGGHSFLSPFLAWTGSKNMRFPEDLSLICLDDSFIAKVNNPPISVYNEPRSEIGRQSLIAIEQIISGQMLPGEQIRIKGDLIIRKSCGLPPR